MILIIVILLGCSKNNDSNNEVSMPLIQDLPVPLARSPSEVKIPDIDKDELKDINITELQQELTDKQLTYAEKDCSMATFSSYEDIPDSDKKRLISIMKMQSQGNMLNEELLSLMSDNVKEGYAYYLRCLELWQR